MAKEYVEQRNSGYYLAGTRISLDSIVLAFLRGDSPETICQNFELLDLEGVYGAIAYYLANQAEVDSYLLGQEKVWAQERKCDPKLPNDLRERLIRARSQTQTMSRS